MAKQAHPTKTTTGRETSNRSAIAAGVFAFEGDWELDLRDQWSIEPMLRVIKEIGELKFIHRRVATIPELEHYINKWLLKRYFDYQVGYFGFHGDPGNLWLDGRHSVSLDDLETMIAGRAENRIIHFGSCSVMRVGESRIRKFQENTRSRAVVGYRRDVDSDLNWAAFEIVLLEALGRYRRIGAADKHLRKNHSYLCETLGFRFIY